jgi:translocation and assembly module TamB
MTETPGSTGKVWWVGGFLVIAVLFVFTLFGLLQTGTAKARIASLLSELSSSEPGRKVVFEKLEGFLPFNMRMGRVTVSDAEGEWLFVEDLVFRWSPLGLLGGRFHVNEAGASRVRVERRPAAEEEKPRESSRPPDLLNIIRRLEIERLAVSEISLGKDVAGQAADFRLEGRLVKAGPLGGLSAAIRLDRTDEGPGTSLHVALEPHLSTGTVSVEVRMHEDSEGWVASLIGLDRAGEISVSLKGDGPPSSWNGRFDAAVARLGSVGADIGIQAEREWYLTVDGIVDSDFSFLSPKWTPALGGGTVLNLKGRFVPSGSASLETLRVENPVYRLDLAGRYDFEKNEVSGEAKLAVQSLVPLERALESPVSGSLSARATVSGTLADPRAHLSIEVLEGRIRNLLVAVLRTEFDLEQANGQSGSSADFRVTGRGSAGGLALIEGGRLPEDEIDWSLDMVVPARGQVALNAFHVKGAAHQFEAAGRIDPSDLGGFLDATLRVADMKTLGTLVGMELRGSASLDVHVDGNSRTRSASVRVGGNVRSARTGIQPLDALLSDQTVLNGSADLRDGKDLTLSSLDVKSSSFQLTAEGGMDLPAGKIRGKWRIQVPRLAPIFRDTAGSGEGSLEADGELSGTLESLDGTAALRGRNVSFDGVNIGRASADLRANVAGDAVRGDFRLELQQDGDRLRASAGFLFQEKQLSVKSLALEAPRTTVKGDIAVDLERKLVRGSLDGRSRDLSELGRFLGKPMAGDVQIGAVFSPSKDVQNVKLQLKGSGLAAGGGRIGRITAAADIADVFKSPRGKAELDVQGFSSEGLVVQSLSLKASGDGREATFDLSAGGKARQEFSIRAGAALTRPDASHRFQLRSLNGRFGEYPVRLVQPATLQIAPGRLSLDRLILRLDGGQIRASGRSSPDSVLIEADFEKLSAETAALFGGPDLNGSAAGTLRIEGPPSRPSGRFSMDVSNIRAPGPALKDLPPVSLRLDVNLDGSGLKMELELLDIPDESVKADVALPVRFSMQPFVFDLPPNGPIRGSLTTRARLETLAGMIPHEDHRLSGSLTGRLDLSGTVASPEIKGDVNVADGSYQNLAQGTVLKAIRLDLEADGRRLGIQRASATDGGRGEISAAGWIVLDPAQDFPLEVEISMSEATLVRRVDATGTVGGRLKLAGTAKKPSLSGSIEAGPADITLPRRMPPSVVDLEVTEINQPPERVQPAAAAADSSTFSLAMDLKVISPGRIRIQGRGLESEWKADLRMIGPSDKLSITGSLDVVRGTFDFLEKRFTLREGAIRFYGSVPPSPFMDITAEARTKDLLVRLLVTGPVSDLGIRIESDPPLPQDEVLARLLFNRNLTDITPLQALKLANAMRAMTGRGSALDVMDRTRRVLGVERLELREAEEGKGGVAVGAGKYLTEDIYVDVEKGVGSSAGKISVQVEVTPNITLESQIGSDANTGVGVNWRYNY